MRALTLLAAMGLAVLPAAVSADADAEQERSQRVLSRHLAGKTPGEAQDCISRRQPGRLYVASDRTLLFRVSQSLVYRNDLTDACPGMMASAYEPVFNSRGSQICRGDTVTVPRGTQPTCVLGRFTPYRRQP